MVFRKNDRKNSISGVSIEPELLILFRELARSGIKYDGRMLINEKGNELEKVVMIRENDEKIVTTNQEILFHVMPARVNGTPLPSTYLDENVSDVYRHLIYNNTLVLEPDFVIDALTARSFTATILVTAERVLAVKKHVKKVLNIPPQVIGFPYGMFRELFVKHNTIREELFLDSLISVPRSLSSSERGGTIPDALKESNLSRWCAECLDAIADVFTVINDKNSWIIDIERIPSINILARHFELIKGIQYWITGTSDVETYIKHELRDHAFSRPNDSMRSIFSDDLVKVVSSNDVLKGCYVFHFGLNLLLNLFMTNLSTNISLSKLSLIGESKYLAQKKKKLSLMPLAFIGLLNSYFLSSGDDLRKMKVGNIFHNMSIKDIIITSGEEPSNTEEYKRHKCVLYLIKVMLLFINAFPPFVSEFMRKNIRHVGGIDSGAINDLMIELLGKADFTEFVQGTPSSLSKKCGCTVRDLKSNLKFTTLCRHYEAFFFNKFLLPINSIGVIEHDDFKKKMQLRFIS